MFPGFEYNEAMLRSIAEGLQTEADDLRRQREDPAPRPDAGRSSGEAAGAIAHLLGSTGDVARLCASMSERLTACLDEYQRVDAATAAEFERIAARQR